jgi:2,4-diaminopentanoate dehydrogenase
MDDSPRIVLYGVGQFGQYVARFADEKGWPIVAAFNRAGAKVDKDVGRLAGLGRDLGVIVEDCDTADYARLEADVAIVATTNRLSENLTAYRRLLGAGLNVICHGAESYYPAAIHPALAAEIDELARAAGVTFTGTGIWDTSRIWSGILAAGPCTEIRALRHSSLTDAERVGREQMLLVGVGFHIDDYVERLVKAAGTVGGLYKSIPHHVLVALGYTVTDARERREPVVFDEPIHCRLLDRRLDPGVVVGTRVIAEVDTAEGVMATADVALRLFREGEVEHMTWAVEGLPVSRVTVEREDSGHATASSMFNRIRDVIAAPPGIVPVSQLGPMRHTALESVARAVV